MARIALVGIYHESNTFLNSRTSLEHFRNGHLLFGDAIRSEYANAFHEVGGILEVLDVSSHEVLPLVFAEATPGGIVTREAVDYLFGRIQNEIRDKGPFDGIMVTPHGAGVSEKHPDLDGWWLTQLRALVGDRVPIIGTLDPHGNVSQAMVEATDALIAYKTNPHIDQRETGRLAAELMLKTLHGEVKPVQFFFQPATTISIEQQYTAASPCKELYEMARQKKAEKDVLAVSVMLGFPYADVPEMGSGFLVVTDNNKALAREKAELLGKYLWDHREEFVGKKITVDEAIGLVAHSEKPVLLLDMGDNVGGGSPGDGTFILAALEEAARWKSFVCIFDPEAVSLAEKNGEGKRLVLDIGGKSDTRHGSPCRLEVTIRKIADGIFQEDEPRHGGQVNYNMGRIAIVESANRTTIMLTSLRIAPFSLKQLTTFGIDPQDYDVLVAKGVHAPMAAYEPVCRSFIRVNTEGITKADMTSLEYAHRRRPLFPFE